MLDRKALIKRDPEESVAPGGKIIIPDNAQDKQTKGTVQAVGPGVRNDQGVLQPLDVKVGDRVIFPKYSGSPIQVDGEELLVIREHEVLAVMEE